MKELETFERNLFNCEKKSHLMSLNSPPLKLQQSIISRDALEILEYSNRKQLLLYLLKNKSEFNFIEMTLKHHSNERSKISRVLLLSEATRLLYCKNSLNSHEFISIIKNIENFYIQLKCPSKCYKKMFEMITNFDDIKVNIFLFVTGLDLSFQKDAGIDSVVIDSSVVFFSFFSFDSFFNFINWMKCSSLQQAIVPSSVYSISDFSFSGCWFVNWKLLFLSLNDTR